MKKIRKNRVLPFLILFVLMVFLHWFANNQMGDDSLFKSALDQTSLMNYLATRYQTWSSRVLIEGTMVLLLQLPFFLWVILNSSMYVLLAYSVSEIFNPKRKVETNWLIVGLLLVMPVRLWVETGWYATTMNYLWPVTFGVFSLIPLSKIRRGESVPFYQWFLFLPAFLFACNQEQVAALLFAFYALALVESLWKKRKGTRVFLFMTLLAIASLVFILFCPGNALRKSFEVGHWYPLYAQFSLFEKGLLGITSTFSKLLLEPNWLFVCCSAMICYGIFKKYQSPFLRFFSALPCLITLCLSVFRSILISLFPNFERFILLFSEERSFLVNQHWTRETWVVVGICFLVSVSFFVSLFLLFRKKKFYLLIPLSGFASRIILGFSPTVFASGMRTFFPLSVTLLITAVLLWQENHWSSKSQANWLLALFLIDFLQITNYLFLYF